MPYFTVTLERYIEAKTGAEARQKMLDWITANPDKTMDDLSVIPEARFQTEVK